VVGVGVTANLLQEIAMKGLFGRLAAVVLALGIVAAPLAAQTFNPNYVGGDGMGVTVSGDFGYGVSDASGKDKYVGGRATIGVSMVVINAGAGYALDTKIASFGGNVAANFLSLPGSPLKVGVYAGANYWSKSGINSLVVPAGALVTISPPSPSIGFDVWLAPGIRYMRASAGGVSASTTKFGGSAGVNVNMPAGFGFHAALDYTNISGGSPMLIGGGIHYKFGMPGM
jgi:hypothetical protein